MAINSNRNFRSRNSKRRYRAENRYAADMAANNADHKYIAMLWDDDRQMYGTAVNGLGDHITGKTIADVQRAVNMEDFWILTFEQWLNS